MIEKEEYTIVLDYLPYGYPLEKKMMPIAQAIGMKNFTLLELVPRKGVSLEQKEKVYIGEGKRDKVYYILGKLPAEKLTEAAKINLGEFLGNVVSENESRFVDFFNKAEAVNTRLHQLELLPGFGKKHTKSIILVRNEGEFKSFEDIRKRVSNIPDPKKAVEKRIIQEIEGGERQRLFVF
ncbi:DNA-binding protein [Candidatus Woesearchaeota archaeon CG10_big_fil_rev_8_21_14_0_10_34_12]|nr:MAG: DNA-binding protein [Candidatus Woesearchaeota archaeon CG10_big_fil_rev_8_21_14_0_10_34_12]